MDFASNTRNTRRLGVVGLAAVFALLSGCFTEPVDAEGTATGGSCDLGAFSCECFEGGCEPGLRCTASNRCITEGCTPGTEVCDCDSEGRCVPGYECTADVCLPQGGTTITPTNTDSNSSAGTSTTGTSTSTTMPTDTMPSTTSADTTATTTEPDTTDATESATTDPPASCPESRETCAECFSCTHDNGCAPEHAECEGEPGCITIVGCMQGCAVDGLCFDNCCEAATPAARSAALALQTCREDTCIAGACRSYAAFECT